MEEKKNKKGRTSSGVSINLSPENFQACTRVGKPPPITSPQNSGFTGRMIGVTLILHNKSNLSTNNYHRKDKGEIKFLLCSIYHPFENVGSRDYNKELDSFYTKTFPRKIYQLEHGHPIGDFFRCFRSQWHR